MSSIIRYTSTSNNSGSYGDKWIAMQLHPNSYELFFYAGTESSPSSALQVHGLVVNEWNDMRVVAIGDVITLFINNVEKGVLSNTNRPQLKSVDVYAADQFSVPSNVIIRDLWYYFFRF